MLSFCFASYNGSHGKRMTVCSKELILLGDLCLVHQTHWPNYMSNNTQIYQFIQICFHMRHSTLSKQERKHRLLLETVWVMHILVPVLHGIQRNLPDISYPYKQCRTTIKGNENIGGEVLFSSTCSVMNPFIKRYVAHSKIILICKPS